MINIVFAHCRIHSFLRSLTTAYVFPITKDVRACSTKQRQGSRTGDEHVDEEHGGGDNVGDEPDLHERLSRDDERASLTLPITWMPPLGCRLKFL